MSGNPEKGHPRFLEGHNYIDLIGDILQKGQVLSTCNWRACKPLDEAKVLCKDRNSWCSVVSAYPQFPWEKGVSEFVCILISKCEIGI